MMRQKTPPPGFRVSNKSIRQIDNTCPFSKKIKRQYLSKSKKIFNAGKKHVLMTVGNGQNGQMAIKF